jgi:hypothetical protein
LCRPLLNTLVSELVETVEDEPIPVRDVKDKIPAQTKAKAKAAAAAAADTDASVLKTEAGAAGSGANLRAATERSELTPAGTRDGGSAVGRGIGASAGASPSADADRVESDLTLDPMNVDGGEPPVPSPPVPSLPHAGDIAMETCSGEDQREAVAQAAEAPKAEEAIVSAEASARDPVRHAPLAEARTEVGATSEANRGTTEPTGGRRRAELSNSAEPAVDADDELGDSAVALAVRPHGAHPSRWALFHRRSNRRRRCVVH